jgi:hypothetical protein
MFTWIFVFTYMIHLCKFQESKNAGSLSSLSSTPLSLSSAPQDVDWTGVVKYSKFLAATIEAHRVISEEHLVEAFDRILRFQGGTKAMVVRQTHLCVHFFTGL